MNNVISFITFVAAFACTIGAIWVENFRWELGWTALILFVASFLFADM